MLIKKQQLQRLMVISLLAVLLLSSHGWAGAYYSRPPFNAKFVWSSSDWHLRLYEESESLYAALIKGSGAQEQGAIIIKAYQLGNLDDPDALVLFHWMMESEYRKEAADFERLSELYQCEIGDNKGYREEMRHRINEEDFRGSIISFARGGIFYQLVFIAMSDVYSTLKSEFEEILNHIEFLESPHPLTRYAPKTILDIKMPIVEASWPDAEELGFSLITPKIISYGSDSSHTILLRISQEANQSTAARRSSDLRLETKDAVEGQLGTTSWNQLQIAIYGVSLQGWEATTTRTGNLYYVGFLTWSFGDRAYLLRIFGPSRDYSRNSLREAAREVLEKDNP